MSLDSTRAALEAVPLVSAIPAAAFDSSKRLLRLVSPRRSGQDVLFGAKLHQAHAVFVPISWTPLHFRGAGAVPLRWVPARQQCLAWPVHRNRSRSGWPSSRSTEVLLDDCGASCRPRDYCALFFLRSSRSLVRGDGHQVGAEQYEVSTNGHFALHLESVWKLHQSFRTESSFRPTPARLALLQPLRTSALQALYRVQESLSL